MTKYSTHRRLYTNSGEFLSSGDAYAGYVVSDNDTFTNLHSEPLTANNTYATDLIRSPFFRDRQIDDVLTFPYSITDIEIGVNDFITDEIINDRFNKLNENTTYLYSKLQAPNSRVPATNDMRYIGVSSDVSGLQWFNTFADTLEYPDTTNFQSFEFINDGIGVLSNYSEDMFTIFAVTSSNFISLTASPTTVGVIENSTFVEQFNNDLTYKKIESIDYHNNILYVCDSGRNAIYKYDIGSYRTGDDTYNNRRILLDIFGSYGESTDKSKFKRPTIIAAKENEVAVYDAGTFTLKAFDSSFNYIATIKATNFRRDNVVAMKYNKFQNELWIVTSTKGKLKLHTIDSNYQLIASVDLFEELTGTNSVRGIGFSENNSDYWYLTTRDFIYKRLISKPYKAIGILDGNKLFVLYDYKWNNSIFTYNSAKIFWNSGSNRSSEFGNFINLNCQFSENNYDRIFLFKYGRFYVYNEPNDYINVLNFYNKENYNIDDISISTQEFIQPSVYNKEIYKLIKNLVTLKNNIVGNFYGDYNLDGSFQLIGYNYDVDFSSFNVNDINDYIVHDNEAVNYYTLNRTLRKVYNLQIDLEAAITINSNELVPQPRTNNILVID